MALHNNRNKGRTKGSGLIANPFYAANFQGFKVTAHQWPTRFVVYVRSFIVHEEKVRRKDTVFVPHWLRARLRRIRNFFAANGNSVFRRNKGVR